MIVPERYCSVTAFQLQADYQPSNEVSRHYVIVSCDANARRSLHTLLS